MRLNQPTFRGVLVFGSIMNLQNFGIDWNFVQRYQTAKSDDAANRNGLLGLFLLGRISRRAGNAAAAAGVLLGVSLIFRMTFSPKWSGALAAWRSPFHRLLIPVFGTLAILLVGLRLSRFNRQPGVNAK